MSLFAFEKISAKRALRIQLIVLGLIILGLVALRITPVEIFINMSEGNSLFARVPDTCSMIYFFGIPCPTCGMSRGFNELIQFNILGSIYYNPFSVVLYPMGFIALATIIIASFFRYKLKVTNAKLFGVGVLVLLAFVWTANIIWGHH
jgi:hypothetical protein